MDPGKCGGGSTPCEEPAGREYNKADYSDTRGQLKCKIKVRHQKTCFRHNCIQFYGFGLILTGTGAYEEKRPQIRTAQRIEKESTRRRLEIKFK